MYFSKTMAALQIHGLPSVKGNPTVLMKRQDVQSPAKQTVLWAPKHTDKLCNKESTHNPVCHHCPDSALLHPASQRTCRRKPDHASLPSPPPHLCSCPALGYGPGSPYLGNARHFLQPVPISSGKIRLPRSFLDSSFVIPTQTFLRT